MSTKVDGWEFESLSDFETLAVLLGFFYLVFQKKFLVFFRTSEEEKVSTVYQNHPTPKDKHHHTPTWYSM